MEHRPEKELRRARTKHRRKRTGRRRSKRKERRTLTSTARTLMRRLRNPTYLTPQRDEAPAHPDASGGAMRRGGGAR